MKSVYITSTAMITPIGLDSAQSAASFRCGIARFSQLPWKDKNYDPFVMASLPDGCLWPLDKDPEEGASHDSRDQRMLSLLGSLRDELAGNLPPGKIPLILGLSERADLTPESAEGLLKGMAEIAGIDLDPQFSKLIPRGRASGLMAVIEGMRLLDSASAPAVLAGGCDTYKDLALLGALDTEARLKSESNRDGFIPGEGACLMLLTSSPPPGKTQTGYRITAAAEGFEEGHLDSPNPYRGGGLFQTLKQLFKKQDPSNTISSIYSSMNGESYWVKEWGVAAIRFKDYFDEKHRLEHPADCYGDLGAASGPVMAGLAVCGMARQHLPGPSLIYASSDHGERAAVIIERIIP